MERLIMIASIALSACAGYASGVDAGIDGGAGLGVISDASCIPDPQTGLCQGGADDGGGDPPPPSQCDLDAAAYCCNVLGFCANAYCNMVFAQGCSPEEQEAAIVYCQAHPWIRHDAYCHPQW